MGISTIEIIKQSSKFTTINFFGKFLTIPRQLVIAFVLGPTELGIVGYVMLWITYARWIMSGSVATLSRELPGLLKTGQNEKAENSQYVAWTADIIISFIVFIGLIIASFFQSSTLIKNLLLIGSFLFLIKRFSQYFFQINWLHLKFSELANIQLYITIIHTILIFLLIYWFKIYALLIAPLITEIINLIFLLKIGAVSFQLRFNMPELFRMMKIGFVISLGSIIYSAFVGIVDNTIISRYLPFDQLGLFIFAYSISSILKQGFSDFGNVLSPILYGHSDTASSTTDAFKDVWKISVYISIFSCIAITLSQVGYILLVEKIILKYIESKAVFMVLSFQIYLESITLISNLILQSNRVNKQVLSTKVMSIGLLLNLIFDIIVIRMGYGIIGVSIVTTVTQGFVSFLLILFSKKYIMSANNSFKKFIFNITLPILCAILLANLNWFLFNYYEIWPFVGISMIINISTWILLISIFYKKYLNYKIIKELIKSILNRKDYN